MPKYGPEKTPYLATFHAVSKCNVRDQVSDDMLRKYFCVKNLCRHVISDHQAGNSAKVCQLKRQKPREVKDNSYKLYRNKQ